MISVTNKIEDFFEKQEGPIIIYGHGDFGTKIGAYMKRCGIPMECYIDKKSGNKNALSKEGIPICGQDELRKYKGHTVRMILGTLCYKDILLELHRLDYKNEFQFLCLIPLFKIYSQGEEYDINRLLGYFRKKLIHGDPPTIISNTCLAGRLYASLGLMDCLAISPTIQSGIKHEDFLKLALNPEHYLTIDMKPAGLVEGGYGRICPSGVIDDLRVYFPHANEGDSEKCAARWNYAKKNIKWNNLFFFAVEMGLETTGLLSDTFIQGMQACCYPYLIARTRTFSKIDLQSNSFFDPMMDKWREPFEKHFDLIEWYNTNFSEK